MNIVLVTPYYPNNVQPTAYVFAQNIAWALRDLKHSVTVICPLNVLREKRYKEVPESMVEKSFNGNNVKVYFPKFFAPWISYKNPVDFIGACSKRVFRKKVEEILDENSIEPDILYAQFLDPAGVCISKLKNKYGAKAIASFGESSLWTISKYFKAHTMTTLNGLDGIDAVSTENKRRLLESGIKDEQTIGIFPNGVDSKRYHQYDKAECRKQLGFQDDAFIVAFLGGFIERKGVLRVAEALETCEGVSVAFAGKGPQQPMNKNAIFKDPVPPDQVARFLSASDIFVLPTLNEGCCNAIIEAMACGLPIVSSDLPFNDDILNDDNSIRVAPNNINQIREAVMTIKNDDALRARMQKAALTMAAQLDISERATNLAKFFVRL